MEAESEKKKGAAEELLFEFCSNGARYRLRVPVGAPLDAARARELAVRVVRAHKLPCYLEDELREQLEEFSKAAALRNWDSEADRALQLAGLSVAEQVSVYIQVKGQI